MSKMYHESVPESSIFLPYGSRFPLLGRNGLGVGVATAIGMPEPVNSVALPAQRSRLLHERMAGNVAIAGQNEMNGLTLNQSVVVTLPGNTRFYLVLQKGTTPGVNPGAERPRPARSPVPNNSVPSLQELRQLLELKREMSRYTSKPGTALSRLPPASSLLRETSSRRSVVDACSTVAVIHQVWCRTQCAF